MKRIFVYAGLILAGALLFTACRKNPKDGPIAGFTFVKSDELAPSEVTFTNTSQHAESYAWDFGNGQTSTEVNPKITYANAGTYTVKLTATGGGQSAEKTETVTIQPPPAASFIIQKITMYAPMMVSMDNTSQNADSYQWDFGYQGQTSTGPTPNFVFREPGTYTITLKARKGTRESVATQTLVVQNDPALVAYYQFPGNAFDYSGNNYDATMKYGANYADSRKAGEKALNLNPVDFNANIRPAAQMPNGLIKNTGAATSISMWFYANSTWKGCLLACQNTDIFAGQTPAEYVPVAYFFQNKLYVKFWNGSIQPIVTKDGVTANAWHHLVIAGDATDQRVYLDNALVGTVSGAISHLNMIYNYLGAGFLPMGGAWPGTPVDLNDPEEFHFYGRIDDVRIYKKKIDLPIVSSLFKE